MDIKKSRKIKELHLNRFYNFRIVQGVFPKKYFESPKTIIVTTLLLYAVLTLIFIFSTYKEMAVKIGLLSIFFSLYKIYTIWKEPSVLINDTGIALRNVRFKWSTIKKIKPEYDFKNGAVILEIVSRENLIIKEKIENFKYADYLTLMLLIRTFKKKNREQFKFNK